eukprot:CAMPEP_0179137744 /NCGR_PEP_ID=MMETSP0796-20121207/65730_1 /TAXON_ID=73915 /ORGANISM="Pyrodinium bahamense, Strain pbaha01" /LENGTH=94 /DNA_ID=CAMNT_0020836949 /DNA_START=85 /DNA_END=366 /DNA_ORIENTATION=-
MAFRSRPNHSDAWEKMYQKREMAASGLQVQDPQETLRKMYDKLVMPQLARRGAHVPLPSEQAAGDGQKAAAKDTKAKEKLKAKQKEKATKKRNK